jgi:hypothetical protein
MVERGDVVAWQPTCCRLAANMLLPGSQHVVAWQPTGRGGGMLSVGRNPGVAEVACGGGEAEE